MMDSTANVSPLIMTAVAGGAAVVSASALWTYSVFVPGCQFWAPVIRALPQSDAVALTFDDGPHPDFTPRILDILAEHRASAMFFVIGQNARKYPDVLRRIAHEGHAIGNHSLDHDHFGVNHKLDYWHTQINDTQRIIADITGQPPLLFRPPMGFKTRHIARAAKDANLPIAGWSLRTCDTKPLAPQALADKTISRTRARDIILLHDGLEPARANGTQQHTVEALPLILQGIAAKKLAVTNLVTALLASVSTPQETPA